MIPKGAKNVPVAKEFLKYLVQPAILNDLYETGLGRSIPCMPSISEGRSMVAGRSAPRGIRSAGRARRDAIGLLDLQPGLCPGSERACLADRLVRHHYRRDDAAGAADKASRRVEEIFAQYPIG